MFKSLSKDLGPFLDEKEKLWEQCQIDLENELSANCYNLKKEIQKVGFDERSKIWRNQRYCWSATKSNFFKLKGKFFKYGFFKTWNFLVLKLQFICKVQILWNGNFNYCPKNELRFLMVRVHPFLRKCANEINEKIIELLYASKLNLFQFYQTAFWQKNLTSWWKKFI